MNIAGSNNRSACLSRLVRRVLKITENRSIIGDDVALLIVKLLVRHICSIFVSFLSSSSTQLIIHAHKRETVFTWG